MISVREDEKLKKHVEYLMLKTGLSKSDIVKKALFSFDEDNISIKKEMLQSVAKISTAANKLSEMEADEEMLSQLKIIETECGKIWRSF